MCPRLKVKMEQLMTQVGHTIIVLGVVASYLKAQKVQNLIEVQRETIDTLQKAFDGCKIRLAQIEEMVKKK